MLAQKRAAQQTATPLADARSLVVVLFGVSRIIVKKETWVVF